MSKWLRRLWLSSSFVLLEILSTVTSHIVYALEINVFYNVNAQDSKDDKRCGQECTPQLCQF